MKRFVPVLLIALLVTPVFAAPKTLSDYKAIYEQQLAQINAEDAGKQSADAAYLKSLSAIKSSATKNADVATVKAAVKETTRFTDFRDLTTEVPATQPAAILMAQQQYTANMKKADSYRSAKVAKMSKKYVTGLKGLTSKLLKAENFDEAEKVDKEIKRVEAGVVALVPPKPEPVVVKPKVPEVVSVPDKPVPVVKPRQIPKTVRPGSSNKSRVSGGPVVHDGDSVDLLSDPYLSKWTAKPDGEWTIQEGVAHFSGTSARQNVATLKDLPELTEIFALSLKMKCKNVREAGFGFGGAFQMSAFRPKDGVINELLYVKNHLDVGFWRNGSFMKKNWAPGRSPRLSLGVLVENNEPHECVFSEIKFRKLTAEEADRLLKGKKQDSPSKSSSRSASRAPWTNRKRF